MLASLLYQKSYQILYVHKLPWDYAWMRDFEAGLSKAENHVTLEY